MNEHYDYIVLGTGLTECILSGLLSVSGKKVLHMDRNDYYGGESASLNLTQIFEQFKKGQSPPEKYGKNRDWNIDLIPKFMMSSGEFVKILIQTQVTNYLQFKQIAGSHVLRSSSISKVPASEMEVLKSSLMGLFEKRRAKKFFEWVQGYDEKDPSTWQNLDVSKVTMNDVYKHFGLEAGTQDFVGHAMALYLDDSYKNRIAREAYQRIILYVSSVLKFGKSPFVYPMYGLGELPQAFARRSAIYGGTYMLSKPISSVLYNDDGTFKGVVSEGEEVYAPKVIGDPSYFNDKTNNIGKVVRVICLMDHPIPNTDNADSCQIILPQNQINRKHDIYVAMVSHAHSIAAEGYYVAIVSTMVETSVPEVEVQPGLELLGPILEKFVSIVDVDEPKEDGLKDNVFISKSYDATSHFETVCEDVKSIFKRAMGKDLDLAAIELNMEQQAWQ